jgi:hypothetical protein
MTRSTRVFPVSLLECARNSSFHTGKSKALPSHFNVRVYRRRLHRRHFHTSKPVFVEKKMEINKNDKMKKAESE